MPDKNFFWDNLRLQQKGSKKQKDVIKHKPNMKIGLNELKGTAPTAGGPAPKAKAGA